LILSIGQFRNSRQMLNAWLQQITNTDVPSLDATNLQAILIVFRDASYLRLRNAQVGIE
jgi:hypothetical protein